MSGSAASTPPVHEAAARRDWHAYFERIEGRPPRQTAIDAMNAFEADRTADEGALAIDLACGSGIDAMELLRRGWRVLAIDASEEALARLRARPEADVAGNRLRTVRCRFEDVELPPCPLLNASFALPFCPPGVFESLWAKIEAAVVPGGRFAGQFFGDRDSWAGETDLTCLSRDGVIGLFDGWVLESLREEDRASTHAAYPKHWHVFHVVARKR